MKLKEIKQKALRLTGNYLLAAGVDFLCSSLNITTFNDSKVKELKEKNQNYILAFWHGTMLLPWYLHRDDKFAGLTSRSKDGDLLAKVLKKWNYTVVRGSSSSGGDEALSVMVEYAKNKSSIALTPDGPRGPARKMKAGAVIAAKRSRIPLVLLGIGYNKKRKLGSWDRFEVPKFFSKVNVIYSEPIYVDNALTYDQTSEMIQYCEDKLNELQRAAEVFE